MFKGEDIILLVIVSVFILLFSMFLACIDTYVNVIEIGVIVKILRTIADSTMEMSFL